MQTSNANLSHSHYAKPQAVLPAVSHTPPHSTCAQPPQGCPRRLFFGKVGELATHEATHEGRELATHEGRELATHEGRELDTHEGRELATHEGRELDTNEGRGDARIGEDEDIEVG